MFNVPVTILYRTDERVIELPSSIPIDTIVCITPIDIYPNTGVESGLSPDLVPRCAIRLTDDRSLVVSDSYHILLTYLDAYIAFEPEFRKVRDAPPDRSGPILKLIHGGICVTSEASTPA